MKLLPMLLAEIRHRRLSALLSVLALACAVALVHMFVLLARAGEQQTRIIQRDIGLNVLVLPAETDIDRYWSLGYSEHSMPAAYIEKLSQQEVANRLIPMLRRRVVWQEHEVMLTGIAPEIFKDDVKKKAVFGMSIKTGDLIIGGTIGRLLDLKPGAEVEFLGETMKVERVLVEGGTAEDITVYVDLADAQRLLNLEGRINEIQAIECHCSEDVADPLAYLRAQLEPLLPGAQIIRKSAVADARRSQRQMAERYLALATPIVLILCGLWIATLAVLNVRERRGEIGLLRALGYGTPGICGLILGRACLLGLLAAVLGSVLGDQIALRLGPDIFKVGRDVVKSDLLLVFWALALTPLFAAVASLLPTALAVTQDPAEVLLDA